MQVVIQATQHPCHLIKRKLFPNNGWLYENIYTNPTPSWCSSLESLTDFQLLHFKSTFKWILTKPQSSVTKKKSAASTWNWRKMEILITHLSKNLTLTSLRCLRCSWFAIQITSGGHRKNLSSERSDPTMMVELSDVLSQKYSYYSRVLNMIDYKSGSSQWRVGSMGTHCSNELVFHISIPLACEQCSSDSMGMSYRTASIQLVRRCFFYSSLVW